MPPANLAQTIFLERQSGASRMPLTQLWELTALPNPLAFGEGARWPSPKNRPRFRLFGPRGSVHRASPLTRNRFGPSQHDGLDPLVLSQGNTRGYTNLRSRSFDPARPGVAPSQFSSFAVSKPLGLHRLPLQSSPAFSVSAYIRRIHFVPSSRSSSSESS